MPSVNKIRTRFSRVSNKFLAIDTKTSDELILTLVTTMSAISIWVAQYNVIVRDGSFAWSRIYEADFVGDLWHEGMEVPLPEMARLQWGIYPQP